jgi:hypothetical protein
VQSRKIIILCVVFVAVIVVTGLACGSGPDADSPVDTDPPVKASKQTTEALGVTTWEVRSSNGTTVLRG